MPPRCCKHKAFRDTVAQPVSFFNSVNNPTESRQVGSYSTERVDIAEDFAVAMVAFSKSLSVIAAIVAGAHFATASNDLHIKVHRYTSPDCSGKPQGSLDPEGTLPARAYVAFPRTQPTGLHPDSHDSER